MSQQTINFTLNGVPTRFGDGDASAGFFQEPMGSWRPIAEVTSAGRDGMLDLASVNAAKGLGAAIEAETRGMEAMAKAGGVLRG